MTEPLPNFRPEIWAGPIADQLRKDLVYRLVQPQHARRPLTRVERLQRRVKRLSSRLWGCYWAVRAEWEQSR